MKISFEDKIAFGSFIKKQRETLSKDIRPLRKIASACEMNFSTLNDIENGNGFPTKHVVLNLAKNLYSDDKKKYDFLDKYSVISGDAPPDIDKYLTSVEGKQLIPILRLPTISLQAKSGMPKPVKSPGPTRT